MVPALVVAYAAGQPDRAEFLTLVCGVAAAPVVAAMASVLSGECIARGAPVVPIAVQAMRSLLPAVMLLVWPTGPLLLFAALLPAGEAVRALVLRAACRRLRARQAAPPTGELTAYGLAAQALSSGVTQLGPAVDRLYLSSAGAGAISSYEMSDRLMYAASELVHDDLHLPPDRDLGAAADDGRRTGAPAAARRCSLARWAGPAVTAAGAGACLAALASGLLPADWHTGFWWGSLVMLSLPAHLFNVVGTRLLVIGRKQHLMLWIAGATAVLNAVLDAVLYLLLGPVGIVVSTVAVRWIMAGVYLVPADAPSSRQPSAGRWRPD